MKIPQVEGLTMLEGPVQQRMAGSRFALPPSFDSTKYASKWVEQGAGVLEAQQSTVLAFAGCEAQGWVVFKVLKVGDNLTSSPENLAPAKQEGEESSETEIDSKVDKPKPARKPTMVPYTRAVGKAVYVLMFRPKALQQAINVLYAGQSREIVHRELIGETSAANTGNDPGIITNADLRKHSRDMGDESEGYIPPARGQTPREAVELNIN